MPIRSKLVLIIISACAVSLVLGLLFFSIYDVISYKREMENNASVNAALVGEYSSAALLFGYREEADEILAKLKAIPGIVNACLYDRENKVFASYSRSDDKFIFPATASKQVEFSGSYLHIFKPIMEQDEKIGTVFLRVSIASLNEKITGNVIICLVLLIVLGGPIYLLASRLQRIISNPILELAEITTRASRDKDYSVRIKPYGKDAVGVLYNRFNEMFEQIEKHQDEIERADADLRKLNEELEDRVNRRTIELKKTNQDLVLAEKAQRDSEQRLRDILNHAPILVYINDLEGRYTFVNKEFERLTGLTYDEVINKTDNDLFSPGHAKRNILQNKKVLKTGKVLVFENESLREDGVHHFADILFPIRDSSGNVYATSGWTIDITDRKKSEVALKRGKEIAEAANKAKSNFLSSMSHELRTPLNAILGFSQLMLRDSTLSSIQKHNLNTINQSGEHLLALINDVLELSKIEAGRSEIKLTTFNLHSLISGLETMFKVKTNSKGIGLKVLPVEHLPQFIISDERKIRQIIINLLGNSIKFTDEGFIKLHAGLVKEDNENLQLYFEVADTGIGIPEDDLERIFDDFEQSSNAGKNQEGTGLGLAISRQYAKLLGGDITVTSRVGEGSRFRFELEVKKGSKEDDTTPGPGKHVTGIKNKNNFKVLVADDRDTNRELLIKMLAHAGFDVRSVKNGKEAIELNNTWKPDLILMDMVMPVLDGFETTIHIKSISSVNSPVIIAITASVLEEEVETILSIGAEDFIRKPFKEEELFYKIGKYCNIEFTYEDSPQVYPESAEKVEHVKEKISLPPGLINDIRKAAMNGSGKQVNLLIKKVYKLDFELAEQLSKFASEYDYKKIIAILSPGNQHG